jgi:hypothetical protein
MDLEASVHIISRSCYGPKQLLAGQGPAGRAAIVIAGEGGCLQPGPGAGTCQYGPGRSITNAKSHKLPIRARVVVTKSQFNGGSHTRHHIEPFIFKAVSGF